MPSFPSVPDDLTPGLGEEFPNQLADPERLVYTELLAACTPGATGVARVAYYGDGRAGQPAIPVTRGWPAFPGKVPAIGVAAGPETEDKQRELGAGGFAGDVVKVDEDTGDVVGSASYYSEPLYATVVVTLIHENRDERDRIHDQLRLVCFPLKRILPGRDPQIGKVSVDAEKAEQAGGPPVAQEPFHIYMSIFTVHVYHELLEATDVHGPDSVLGRIDVSLP